MRVIGLTLGLVLFGCSSRLPSLPESTTASGKRRGADSCDAVPRVIAPGAPATLWSVRFEAGVMKPPRNDGMDWFGMVLRGAIEVEGCGTLDGWTAFKIAGGKGSATVL
jgi:hypothetical protein